MLECGFGSGNAEEGCTGSPWMRPSAERRRRKRRGGRSDGTDTRSKISFYPDSVKNIRKIKINLFYEHRLDICE